MKSILLRLVYLNSWSPLGGVFRKAMESLGGRALLEEVVTGDSLWGFTALLHFLFSLSASCVRLKCAAMPYLHLAIMDSRPQEP